MKTILLIRHGSTAGNREKRYIGRTDEPLCDLGNAQAAELASSLPVCGRVFSSPLLRCRQTAEILFPAQTACVIPDLRECDFGVFEGKNAAELADDPAYGEWLSSYCTAPIPGGEDVYAFRKRSSDAFARAAFSLPENHTAAFVTHGGCIMAILERFALPKRDFYDYRIDNGLCVICACDGETLTVTGGPLC